MATITYATASLTDNEEQVIVSLMEFDQDADSRCVTNVFVVDDIRDIAFIPEFDNVHYVSEGMTTAIIELDALDLAGALECYIA